MPAKSHIRRDALRIDQNSEHPLYMLTMTGDELLRVADVWHASRDKKGRLQGYQRPEAKQHIKDIAQYLDGEDVLFPNPIILALSSKATFKKRRVVQNPKGRNAGSPGVLEIPIPRAGQRKPAWVVDGQQRMMALAKSRRAAELVVPVNAFVTDDVAVQREQFLRVNSSKPLPRGLIHELLPALDAELPPRLSAKKLPSALCDALNQDTASPFFGLIRRSSMDPVARRRAVVNDNSIMKMLEASLNAPSGCLFGLRNVTAGTADTRAMLELLFVYWSAVRDVFPDAWGRPPAESRLMHGVGIQAMGKLMDKVMSANDPIAPSTAKSVRKELRSVRPTCRWTEGEWEDLGLRWNDVQNVAPHLRKVTDTLLWKYFDA